MKKKFGDMTIKEVHEMCENYRCSDCPNIDACNGIEGVSYLGLDLDKEDLETVFEIEQGEK